LSIVAKLELYVYGGRTQGPLLLYPWRSRMLAMLRALHSFLADTPKRVQAERRSAGGSTKTAPQAIAPRISIVALVVSDHDREVLNCISNHEPVDIHFAESHGDAWEAMNRLNSAVILYDRDWPNAEWRTTVQAFASSPHRSCVILASRVADDYLWQELIRCGGYDLLAKPFRPDDVTRAFKLALSYWRSSSAAATQ
jgi:CheY-like chemotaxis protein